ncbi:hypothetical protein FPRO05_08234 [Fusarium proliferatum]|uniref:Uncharacterized protein n=1 Tax=Gibberella intermedia TaxID=948311 RepID=A0A365NIX9_GIBIN|nr:hypothetical protein FPRO05_08234 [Fusarium proliferatum]
MKCDGYAPPKPNASKRSKRREPPLKPEVTVLLPLLSMQTVDQLSLLSDSEKGYLQHFLHWTAKQLSPSSAAMNFWLEYALPMSYHYDAIRYSMIAVGASHRAYMAQSLPYSRPDHLQRPVIQHYNRAISSILPIMSAPSNENIHCILICCLLFMTCEGLTGRYDELLQHLAAGDTVFQSLRRQNTSDASDMLEGLVDMFSEMGLASSGFMGDHPLSGIKKWCRISGLSFVAISNEGGDERLQALDLLRKLNHREGIFDSNDIVEMHEMVAMEMDWGSGSDSDSDSDIEEPDPPLRAPKGIPQMLEVLARKTGTPSKRLEGLYP